MIYKRTCEEYKKEVSLQNKMGGNFETTKKYNWLVGNNLDKLNQVYSYSKVLSHYHTRINVEQKNADR